MASTASLDSLIEGAILEAKLRGHTEVGVLHVALTLAKRDEVAFATRFGGGAVDSVRQRLDGVVPTFGVPALSEALAAAVETARGSDEPLQTLLDWLADQDVAAEPPPDRVEGAPDEGAAADHGATVAPGGDRSDASDTDRRDGAGGRADDGAEGGEATDGGSAVEELLGPLLVKVEVVTPTPVVGRAEAVEAVVEELHRRRPAIPCIVGAPGSGRTSVLRGVAEALAARPLPGRGAKPAELVRLRAVRCARDPEGVLRLVRLLGNRPDVPAVVALDDLDVLLSLDQPSADLRMVSVLGELIEHEVVAGVATISPDRWETLGTVAPGLQEALHRIDIEPLDGADLRGAVDEIAERLSDHHGVDYPDDVLEHATGAGDPDADHGIEQPGLASLLLDRAGARVARRGRSTVEVADVVAVTGADAGPEPLDGAALGEVLRREVRGQDGAVERVVQRLLVTRGGIDLRPERPDGVFLFIGPTGVGKTELARALGRHLYGGDERVIRLDMSEYAESWALSRLIGPQPGYVGYTEPGGWLTTRVRRQPDTVVLLDEIEKAHPGVWNAFLQVFDAGHLTDSRGDEVSFSSTVMVLTSNVGADAFARPAPGFATATTEVDVEERAISMVRDLMAPELVNRLDDIVVFHPLDETAIREIAEQKIADALAGARSRGYEATVDREVVDLVASEGFDIRYGARHLERNVERLVLGSLARMPVGAYAGEVDGGVIRWVG